MQEHAKEFDLMKVGWKCLIASYFGEKISITIDYITWFLDQGLIVTKGYQFLCYKKAQPFKGFQVSFVTESTHRSDVDKTLTVIAQTYKLTGNSAYGMQLNNKSAFENNLYG